jgi:hypothetical protein
LNTYFSSLRKSYLLISPSGSKFASVDITVESGEWRVESRD